MNEKLNNTVIELCVLGALFNEPDIYIDYGKLIKSKYDFADSHNKWLYDKFELFYMQYCDKKTRSEISENQFNVMILQDDSDLKTYKELGSWGYIEQIKKHSDSEAFEGYFEVLKKYSLLRELHQKGFPSEKILSYKNFDKLTGEQILNIIQYNINNIITDVYNAKGVSIVTEGVEAHLLKYMENPYLGVPYKFKKYTELFLGQNKGDLMIEFGYVNSGKSRKSVSRMADLAFVQNKKIVTLDNEMSEIKVKNAMIATILNDPSYGYCLNKPEREIKLGIYKDEAEKKKVLDIARFIESNKNWYFVEMYKYSDLDIEREIKKYVVGLGCEFVNYGTLKGHKTEDWAVVKQTATHLKNLAGELGIFISAQAQMTTESINIDIFDLSEQNIASAKQIVHVADVAVMDKEIFKHEYDKYQIKDADGWGSGSLNKSKRYYGSKVLKNREGQKPVLINEIDLDTNVWGEYSYLERSFKK